MMLLGSRVLVNPVIQWDEEVIADGKIQKLHLSISDVLMVYKWLIEDVFVVYLDSGKEGPS